MSRSSLRSSVARPLVAALLTIIAVHTGAEPTASAQVLQTGAQLQCAGSTMYVYPPGTRLTQTNTANSMVAIFTDILAWNGTQWVKVADTGWWAFAMTNHRGYLSPVLVNYGEQARVNVTRVINSQLTWLQMSDYAGAYRREFTLTPGYYYAAMTWMYDYADGSFTYVVHHTSASDPSTPHYCLA